MSRETEVGRLELRGRPEGSFEGHYFGRRGPIKRFTDGLSSRARGWDDPRPASDGCRSEAIRAGRLLPSRGRPTRVLSEGFQTAEDSASDSWWVIRRISSMVVRPFIALIIPSSKSVCIPCLRATLRMAWVGSPLKVMSRIVL